ncbi:hypothetical protein [Lacticaseibacillus paracasei]|uniref:hypothetical protein n=1 Tax=Lacticaseibacillus paracasei TaxID=1597 RepID=UPI0021A54039|nr:hypothetical protein [Lacticaseibacillus paracasei]MCT4385011.1 hypothetical protein [Lacticaseibacillus paracasei]
MNRDKKVWGALLIVLFNRSIFRYIEALWTNNMIFGNVLKGLSAIVTCAAIYVLIRCLHLNFQVKCNDDNEFLIVV